MARRIRNGDGFGFQRFRQQETGDDEIDEGQRRGAIEGNARTELTEETANDGTERKADTEGHADQAEILRPVLVVADVGDIGGAGREAARR